MGIFAAADAAKKASGGSTEILLLIVLVFAGFYFMLIRPQRRRQQQAQQQQRTVSPGARVRTTAGMYATVSAVDGDDVILEVAPGVDVRYMKRAIMEVISSGEAEDAEETAYDEPGHGDDDTSAEDDTEVTDHAGSAAEGLADSHDDVDSTDKDKDNVF
jgi:preprotein translocase subunit YajC